MSNRVSLTDSRPQELEVELWDGHAYAIKRVTKAYSRQADAAVEVLEEAIAAAETSDEVVKALCEMFDLRLTPVGGKRTKASTLILRRWDADEISVDEIEAMAGRLLGLLRPN